MQGDPVGQPNADGIQQHVKQNARKQASRFLVQVSKSQGQDENSDPATSVTDVGHRKYRRGGQDWSVSQDSEPRGRFISYCVGWCVLLAVALGNDGLGPWNRPA